MVNCAKDDVFLCFIRVYFQGHLVIYHAWIRSVFVCYMFEAKWRTLAVTVDFCRLL